MSKKIFILFATICFGAAAHAQISIIGAGTTNLVLSSSTTPLALGDIVEIGYFSNTANLGTDNTLSDLTSIFKPIGQGSADGDTLNQTNGSGNDTLVINNYGGVTGAFEGQFNNVNAGYIPQGDLLYMWVFNSSNINTATEWGIFEDLPFSGHTGWVVPASPGSVSVVLANSDVTAIRGGSTVINGTTDFTLANIATVPEPSTFASLVPILILGCAFLLRRRHRG